MAAAVGAGTTTYDKEASVAATKYDKKDDGDGDNDGEEEDEDTDGTLRDIGSGGRQNWGVDGGGGGGGDKCQGCIRDIDVKRSSPIVRCIIN